MVDRSGFKTLDEVFHIEAIAFREGDLAMGWSSQEAYFDWVEQSKDIAQRWRIPFNQRGWIFNDNRWSFRYDDIGKSNHESEAYNRAMEGIVSE